MEARRTEEKKWGQHTSGSLVGMRRDMGQQLAEISRHRGRFVLTFN